MLCTEKVTENEHSARVYLCMDIHAIGLVILRIKELVYAWQFTNVCNKTDCEELL